MQTLLHKKWQTDILPGIKKTPPTFNFWTYKLFDKPVLDKLIMYIILIPLPVLFLF